MKKISSILLIVLLLTCGIWKCLENDKIKGVANKDTGKEDRQRLSK